MKLLGNGVVDAADDAVQTAFILNHHFDSDAQVSIASVVCVDAEAAQGDFDHFFHFMVYVHVFLTFFSVGERKNCN